MAGDLAAGGFGTETGMAFAAATALGEFAVSVASLPPEWTTLTTLIYQRLGRPVRRTWRGAGAGRVLMRCWRWRRLP
ncbi:MAG: hypothetical protein R3E42_18630 [Burkholderiaceae bacterium]